MGRSPVNLQRMFFIARKELRQLRRDRMTAALMAVFPLLQLTLFGYAINTDVRHTRTVVYDQDHSAASRDLWRSMAATEYYDVVGHVGSYGEVEAALRRGEARVAVVIPPDFAASLASAAAGSPRGTTVQLIVDGSDPQTVGAAINTASSLVAARSGKVMSARLAASTVGVEPIRLEPSTWYNQDLRTAVYVVPGLIGVILSLTMVMLTAMAITRERERGTLEQLIVSPVRSVELTLGKIVPFVGIGYVQMTLVLVAGRLIFGVPFVGSVPLLYALAFVFIAASLAVGLFFSTLAQTQQQAMQLSYFYILPNILLSGFMFPFEAMPKPAQVLSQALPLTHFLRIVRGIVLRGARFEDLAGELMWLVGLLALLLVVASLRFKKKLG